MHGLKFLHPFPAPSKTTRMMYSKKFLYMERLSSIALFTTYMTTNNFSIVRCCMTGLYSFRFKVAKKIVISDLEHIGKYNRLSIADLEKLCFILWFPFRTGLFRSDFPTRL